MATRVHSVADVGTGLREIRLQGAELERLRFPPGSHVVVRVPTAGGEVRRVYSIWAWHPQQALISLRVALHATTAPGCAWALTAAPGDAVRIEPPRTKISIDPGAAFHVFAGDETAAVPLLSLIAALHRAGTARPPRVIGVFESAAVDTEVPGAEGVPSVLWVHRGRASAIASPVLVQAVRRLALPAGVGVAYLAGESETCRLLQRHFIEVRGWPRRAVKVQPQWARGRPGFGAGTDEPEHPRGRRPGP